MKFYTLSILAVGVGLVACSGQQSDPANVTTLSNLTAQVPVNCDLLNSSDIANTTIMSSESIAAGMFTLPVGQGFPQDFSNLPAFCRVIGTIKPTPESDIRFEIWLPSEGWNGKFMQTGNGGAAGAISHSSLAEPLIRGYAVANTDTGHQGGGGDFSWAVGEPEKLADYAYRAVHELTVAGKSITASRYGRVPDKSYWSGCSTGGRQGLKEAQLYPEDYDAIIAGAPASNWSALMSLSILTQNNLGTGGLGVDKLGILKEAAIESCDALDGVTDHVITNPAMCSFDPVITQCQAGQVNQCLSVEEVAAARRIYPGVIDSTGQVKINGTGPGSEPLWVAYATPQFSIGTNYFRNVVMQDQDWDPATFNIDTDLALAEEIDAGDILAMNPDISDFIDHGGKLITYHGTTDGLIPFGNSLNYFESMISTMGEETVNNNVRLYLVPGMDHCSGGEGAFVIDWLTTMEEWSDQNISPSEILATHPVSFQGASLEDKEFTRPVCPYPATPSYIGTGAIEDYANWSCLSE